ncbi:hypothetical protein FACS1894110_20060 [Spirochaetia bacterium]|nr:hypothetical protein FACS1894110_20060 [Spirochaetia bacterium]
MTEKSVFVIPQSKGSIIARMNDSGISEIAKLDVPYHSKSIVTENGLIVSLCFGTKPKSRRLRIFDKTGKQLIRKTEYKYASIACKNNAVYLGGRYGSKNHEIFAFIDLEAIDFTVKEVDLPVPSMEGKSIDDILINGNRLILVDNIVYPKYLFEYDITIPNKPVHKETKELPNNGTYEHIYKGDINDNWMALFSSSVGMGGAFQHISIFGKQDATVSFCVNDMDLRSPPVEEPIIDICLLNDYLLILKKSEIAYIDLNKEITNENIKHFSENQRSWDKLLKIEDNCLLLNEKEYELLRGKMI